MNAKNIYHISLVVLLKLLRSATGQKINDLSNVYNQTAMEFIETNIQIIYRVIHNLRLSSGFVLYKHKY